MSFGNYAGRTRGCARNVKTCQRPGLGRWRKRRDRFCTTDVFRFVEVKRADYSVATLYRVLGVSPSGYYAWRNRRASSGGHRCDSTGRIQSIYALSRGIYCTPRIQTELTDEGWRISSKQVAWLRQQTDQQGVARRKGTFTNVPDDPFSSRRA